MPKPRRNSIRKNSIRKKKKRTFRKHIKRNKRRSNFGYSHSYAPNLYNATEQDGILLADDAFSWMGNPTARALNA